MNEPSATPPGGRHRRPGANQPATLAKAAGVTAAGAALPLLAAGASSAAALHSTHTATEESDASTEASADAAAAVAAAVAQIGGDSASSAGVHADARLQTLTPPAGTEAADGTWALATVQTGSATPAVSTADTASTTVHTTALSASLAEQASATAPKGKAAVHHEYTVRPGDDLYRIALDHHVPGGWQALYRANAHTIGSDPNLIRPGERLTWTTGGSTTATPKPAPKPAPTTKPHPKPTKPHPKPSKPKPSSGGGSGKATSADWSAPIRAHFWISEAYGVKNAGYAAGHHTGVDLAVPTGTSVYSVGDGTVVDAGWGGDYGNYIQIHMSDGRYTLYAHLSVLDAHVGEDVHAGELIAKSGATGNVTGPHLHFEVRTTSVYGSDINPVTYLADHGIHI